MAESQSNTNRIIAIGAGLLLLTICAGGTASLVTIGVITAIDRSAPTQTTPSSPGPRRPLVIGSKPVPSTTQPKAPLIRPGQVSGPPPTEPAFDAGQCDEVTDGGPVAGPDCVTAEIHCDDTVIGHTIGGVDRYPNKFWEKKYCWPATVDHNGGNERVYKLVMPPGEWRAWVDLHTPCADLDVMGIRSDHGETCPSLDTSVNQCEAAVKKGKKSERIEMTSQTFGGKEATWYVVVEGRGDAEGPFSLHVQCHPGLGGPVQ